MKDERAMKQRHYSVVFFEKAKSATSFFAPVERASLDDIEQMIDRVKDDPLIRVILDAVDGYVLILNTQRQALAGNQELLDALGLREMDSLVGLRPGEIFHCVHAEDAPSGCGTSLNCEACGAVLAILASMRGGAAATDECRLTMTRNGVMECLEFHVRCTPLKLAGESLLIFVLQNISSTKRREALERLFVHDIRNTVQGLMGWSSELALGDAKQAAQKIADLSRILNDEVDNQHMLMLAERGQLRTRVEATRAEDVLDALENVFHNHPSSRGRRLEIQIARKDTKFETDLALLMRALTNMVKNALEATPEKGLVKVRYERRRNRPSFIVWNEGRIPDKVALQVFHRSFSTKEGPGRGLGTYGMKLFGERYLGGKVSFETSEKDGTSFILEL
jgi:K+-sensing histidine kinase KdpD